MPKDNFREAFLHYVWQHQYFNKNNLSSTNGESIQVLYPGFINPNSGPDFYNCRLLIGQIEWHGTVEVHYKTSDWDKHKHSTDKAYNNVVLHLVWEQDVPSLREDGSMIPTLELKNRVDKILIERYKSLVNNSNTLPCSSSIDTIDPLFTHLMLDRTLAERMELKASEILLLFEKNKRDWEETCYQWLGKCYGFKVNSEPFLRLCKLLPYSILKKYHNTPRQLEALLFGTANLLNEFTEEEYVKSLTSEFLYLQHKHSLTDILNYSEWKFLRLRPANFPTLRLAQFSACLTQIESLFEFVFGENSDYDTFTIKLGSEVNTFWSTHFHFGKQTHSTHHAEMGIQSIENIVINAIVPLRFARAMYLDIDGAKEECLDLLRKLSPEKNKTTSYFSELKIVLPTAYETQASIQLYNHYCSKKNCLSCAIGHAIIHPKK